MKRNNNNLMLEKNVKESTINETMVQSKESECRDIGKIKEYNRKQYLKNRLKIIEKSKEWGRNNPEKVKARRARYRKLFVFRCLAKRSNFLARKANDHNRISDFDLWKIAKKQKLLCALTGDKLVSSNASVDHIIPTSKGGKNVVTNIRLVTKDANFMKNSHSDEEFLKLCKKIITTIGN